MTTLATWALAVTALAMAPEERLARAEHPGDYVRILEDGPSELWDAAVLELVPEKRSVPSLAVSSVLRRLDQLGTEARRRVAAGLGTGDVIQIAALARLARDPDPEVRELAVGQLRSSHNADVQKPLGELLPHLEPSSKKRVLGRLTDMYAAEQAQLLGWTESSRLPPKQAARASLAGVRDERLLPRVEALIEDPDPDVRSAAVRALSHVVDGTANDSLFGVSQRDPAHGVRRDALWALAARHDARGCEGLLEDTKDLASSYDGSRSARSTLRSVGGACAPHRFLGFFEQYRRASGAEREALEQIVRGGLDRELLEQDEVVHAMERYENDEEPLLRETARTLLEWREKAEARQNEGARATWIRQALLTALVLIAAWLGLVLFLWGFRLLQLRRLARGLAVSRVRSLALGTVALQGEAQPLGGRFLKHPQTGEICLFYAGADRDGAVGFHLEDKTGRVEIDAVAAVLVSEDGIVVPGERIHLVGTARRQPGENRETSGFVVAKQREPRTAFERLSHLMIQGVMGRFARSGTARLLFSDPRRCFWIWDDASGQPFGSARETALLFGSFLLAGAWIFVFGVALLALIER